MDDGIQAIIARIGSIAMNDAMDDIVNNLADRVITLEANATRTTSNSGKCNRPITESRTSDSLPLLADASSGAVG